MQPLPTAFEDRTFRYRQLVRAGTLAVFEQEHKTGHVKRYEVVRIRIAPPHVFPTGLSLPEREVYPGASAWGRDGFTFYSEQDARAWMQQMQGATVA